MKAYRKDRNAVSEPAGAEPMGMEPTGMGPTGMEPMGVEPMGGEWMDPADVEPAGGEWTDPAGAEPVECEQASLLDAYADGELTPEEAARLREHLDGCPSCQALLDDILAIREAFPALEDTEVPEGFADRVLERLPPRVSVLHGGRSARGGRRRDLWRRAALPVAASLALMLALRGVWLTGGPQGGGEVMTRTLPVVGEAVQAAEGAETGEADEASQTAGDTEEASQTAGDTEEASQTAGDTEEASQTAGDTEEASQAAGDTEEASQAAGDTEEASQAAGEAAEGTESQAAEKMGEADGAGERSAVPETVPAVTDTESGPVADDSADSGSDSPKNTGNTGNGGTTGNTGNAGNTGNTGNSGKPGTNGRTGSGGRTSDSGTSGTGGTQTAAPAAPPAPEPAAVPEAALESPAAPEPPAPSAPETSVPPTAGAAVPPTAGASVPPATEAASTSAPGEDPREGWIPREWESGGSSPASGYEDLEGAVSLLGIEDPSERTEDASDSADADSPDAYSPDSRTEDGEDTVSEGSHDSGSVNGNNSGNAGASADADLYLPPEAASYLDAYSPTARTDSGAWYELTAAQFQALAEALKDTGLVDRTLWAERAENTHSGDTVFVFLRNAAR